MALREKILVGLMLAAVLYGGYVFLDSRRTGDPAPTVQEASPAGVIAQSALDIAAQSRLDSLEWYILETALGTRGRNPFQRLEDAVQETIREGPALDAARPVFVYEGFLETEGLLLALINGRAYAEGEYLKEPGYVLQRIMDKSIILVHRSPAGAETWREEIYLEDGFL